MTSPLPDGVTTAADHNTVCASIVVDATPTEVFSYIRRPANHPAISGDHTVKGTRTGPDSLDAGSRFGMRMKVLGVPYNITSKVVEFEVDRLIAWCHLNGHRWRWQLAPTDDGRTTLTETFDLSTARFPPALRAAGFPKRHEQNVARSVANVAEHFRGQSR